MAALYARFAKTFATHPRLHEFWFGMARDEARHVGALDLVATVLDFEGMLDRPSPVALDDAGATVPADTIPEDKTILASVKVVGTSAAFLPGTDNWNKAGVTFTFSDGYDASMVGAYRVNTRV